MQGRAGNDLPWIPSLQFWGGHYDNLSEQSYLIQTVPFPGKQSPPLPGHFLRNIPIQPVERKHFPDGRGVGQHVAHCFRVHESSLPPLQQYRVDPIRKAEQ